MQETNRTEFKMELVEQIGSGMSRILKVYDHSIFEISPSFTVVTFPYEEALILPNGEINGKTNGEINDEINDEVSDKVDSLLEILKSNPTITIPKLAELTGKSQRSISRELRELQDAGLLWREGARKNGRWIVK